MKEKKQNGKVFTPGFIVKNVLDACGYEGEKFENSSEFNAHYKSRINDANLIGYDDALLPDELGGSVIFNDYEAFSDKIYHAILAI